MKYFPALCALAALAFATPAQAAEAFNPEPSAPLAAETPVAAEAAPALTPRNSFEVSYTTAEEAVNQALTEKGVADKVSAAINGHSSKGIFAYTKPLTVQTRGLQYDQKTNRWSASLLFMDGEDVVSALPASGHFDQMMEVPVLKREIRTGELIRDSDIEIRDFAMNHTRADTVSDLSSLIGKAPIHSISPYRPIRDNEVATPSLIKKDALIQMRYSLPGMEITASGEAISAGAKGDVITVRNVTSKKIVRAVVEDSNTVRIAGSQLETSQLTGDSHATN